MKVVGIEQITNDNRGLMFMGYNFTQKKGGVDDDEYSIVYLCTREDDYTPDDAYEEFNMYRPNDFLGHSLSVSDIVIIGEDKYFCDTFGWIKLK